MVLRCSRAVAEARWAPWADPALARVLRDPTIVRMVEAGEIGDHRYFLFEHVDGVDLRQLLHQETIPRDAALLVTRTIADALRAASVAVGLDRTAFAFHHGAIAPRWVFVARSGGVKLGGFGLGRLGPAEHPGSATALEILGPAPEELMGNASDTGPSDIFQLGRLLHRMLFGADFVSEALARILGRMTGRAVVPTAIPATEPAIERLLRQLLSERPEDRPPVHEVRTVLDSLLGGERAESEARAWLASRVEAALGHRR